MENLLSRITSEQIAAAEQISAEVFEKTGVYIPDYEIIKAANAKQTVFEIKTLNITFPKEIKVTNTRHAKYGNTFLK